MSKCTAISVAFVLCCAARMAEGGPLTTIVDNGPSSNRVDIVFLGDGYTAADIAAGRYAADIGGFLSVMFSNTPNSDPFYRYRNYFNVHSVEVVSNQSGADVPPEGIFRDTALDATYYFDGSTAQLLYLDPGKANAQRDAALAGAGFSAEMQFVTVNDSRYGGGGGEYAVFASGDASSFEVAMHESAHSFSQLADEYVVYPGAYFGPEPHQANVTTDPTGAKWSHWLGYDQPGIGVIGVYQGARYYAQGIYRPSQNSKLRSLDRPFDAVAREKLILDIYDLVEPFDAWRDNALELFDPGALFVDPIDDELIEVQWFVDGALIDGASDFWFDLISYGFGPGEYDVVARGFDPTGFDPTDGWVRINQSALEQTIAWSVILTVPEPATLPLLLLAASMLGIPMIRPRRRRTSRTPRTTAPNR